MLDACEKNKVKMAVISQMRFSPAVCALKSAVDRGDLGKIVVADLSMKFYRSQEYYDKGGWRGTWAMDGGGALSNQGIHEIDRILAVFGKPQAVKCMTTRQTFNIEAEDYGISEWKYQNGMIARFSCTTSYPVATWYTRLEVYGDKGAYLLTAGGPEGDHIYWYIDGKWTENSPYPTKREWNQGADNFANTIRTGQPLVVKAEEGRNSRYILDKMYESAKNGEGWVEIKDFAD